MDISNTIAADSTQVNAEDVIGPPRIVTITGVSKGSTEQPVNIELAEFPGKSFRPCKSMRRVLVQAWGPNASEYVGRRMSIFNDPTVKFGGQAVGGVRIKALSHIGKSLTIPLMVTRGKRAPYTVDPLPDAPTSISAEAVAEFEQRIGAASTAEELAAIGADLKSCDLGTNRKRLQEAWGARRSAIAHQAASVEGSDAAAAPAASEFEPEPEPEQVPVETRMASKVQLAKLKQIREAEKYDQDADWFAWLSDVLGVTVGGENDITADQAAQVIGMFNGS